MTVKVNTGFSKSRIESFYRFHIRHVSKGRFIEYALILICSIVGILGVFVFEEVMVTIVALLIAIIIIGTYNWRIYYATKRFLKNTPMDSRTYTILLDENKVTFIEDNMIKVYEYKDLFGVKEIDECYYLYISDFQAIIVPKYTISHKQKEELVKIFQEKCDYRRYKFISATEEEGVV